MFEIESLENAKFPAEKTLSNLGPKMPSLSIFGYKFEKLLSIFDISNLKFVKTQNFVQK